MGSRRFDEIMGIKYSECEGVPVTLAETADIQRIIKREKKQPEIVDELKKSLKKSDTWRMVKFSTKKVRYDRFFTKEKNYSISCPKYLIGYLYMKDGNAFFSTLGLDSGPIKNRQAALIGAGDIFATKGASRVYCSHISDRGKVDYIDKTQVRSDGGISKVQFYIRVICGEVKVVRLGEYKTLVIDDNTSTAKRYSL